MKPSDEQKLAELKAANPDWGRVRLARELGLSEKAVRLWLEKLKNKALYSDAAEGFYVNKRTVHVDSDGKIKQQWIKTSAERRNELELFGLMIEEMSDACRGKSPKINAPSKTASNLITIYPIADAHLGLYAWADETGTDWDTEKCESAINGCMEHLVECSPATDECLIPNLADFFHTDNESNQTSRSGHVLDVDTRQAKVFLTGVRSYRRMIELALTKHKKVVAKFSKGNHDDHSILGLAVAMMAYFENNPRVEIHLPINPFAYHQFGQNLYGMHHGNLKRERYPGIMAADVPEMWGSTKYRTFLTAHIHNETKFEAPGCTVESFRSPAAKDSWTHASGYRAGRDMQSILADIERGEVGRNRISVESLT